MPRLLVDAEFYLYRYATAFQEDYEWETGIWSTFVNVEQAATQLAGELFWLRDILGPPCRELKLYRGDPRRSFRHSVYPPYKSNRKAQRKPVGYAELLRRVLELCDTSAQEPWDLLEGDDMLGVNAREGDILIGVDKDFATLPFPRIHWEPWETGWRSRRLETIQQCELEADRCVFRQALSGDAADGYPGCPGVGKVKAEVLLRHAHSELEMWQITKGAFEKAGLTEASAVQMVQCARILRPGDYDQERRMPLLWQPPLG